MQLQMLSVNPAGTTFATLGEHLTVRVNTNAMRFIALQHSDEKLARAASDIDHLGSSGKLKHGNDAVGFF